MSLPGNQFIKYALILFFGTIFSAYLFYSVNDKYLIRNKSLVDTAKAKVQVKLINELDRINLAMESMETLIKNSDTISYPVFSELTNPFLGKLNGLKLLGWGPQLHRYQTLGTMMNCSAVKDSACDKGLNALKIIEIYTDSVSGAKTPMATRDLNSSKQNVISTSVKNAIAEAINSRKVVLSNSFQLMSNKRDKYYFISALPVFHLDDASINGISFGLFDLEEFVQTTLVYELPVLDIEILDRPIPPPLSIPLDITNNNYRFRDTLHLSSGGKGWDVIVSPKQALQKYPHSIESYFVLLLGIFSSLLLLFVIKQRDEYATRLTKEVKERTIELEESNRLKETLLREIHHRVKNNLQIASSLMNLQKRKLTDTKTIDAFTSSQGRISAIALIHEEIYQHRDIKAVDFNNYLNDLIKYHRNISPSVSYQIDCPNISLDLDTAVPVALITSELLVNSLKHAFEDEALDNRIWFKVHEGDGGSIELSISDNGKGLPKDFDIKGAKGLGFEIVQKLCRQISADFSFETTAEGTAFLLKFTPRG